MIVGCLQVAAGLAGCGRHGRVGFVSSFAERFPQPAQLCFSEPSCGAVGVSEVLFFIAFLPLLLLLCGGRCLFVNHFIVVVREPEKGS